jgi:hypothetical protein
VSEGARTGWVPRHARGCEQGPGRTPLRTGAEGGGGASRQTPSPSTIRSLWGIGWTVNPWCHEECGEPCRPKPE